MTEEIYKLWGDGGLVPMDLNFIVVLSFSAVVFAWRLFRKRAGMADFVIAGMTGGSSLVILALTFIEGGTLQTFWRYHYPGYVLALAYCAYGILGVSRRYRRAVAGVLCVAAAAYIGFGWVQSVRHARAYERHAADSWKRCEQWAAEVIRADWKGPARGPREPLDLDYYVTDRRPLVFAHTARSAYLAGARLILMNRHVCGQGEPVPDYWVLAEGDMKVANVFYPECRRRKIASRDTRYGTYSVYRTIAGEGNGHE